MPVRLSSAKDLARLGHLLPADARKAVRRRRRVAGTSPPQRKLWAAVKAAYPEAEQEKGGLVPGKRYTADIVLERCRLVIELDGWEFHGRYKSGFLRDRQKDRSLMLAGYRICRFTAGEVMKNLGEVMRILGQVVAMIEEERGEQSTGAHAAGRGTRSAGQAGGGGQG